MRTRAAEARKACTATRKDGQPCRAEATRSSDYCFVHDPELAGKRADARRNGGFASSRAERAASLMPVGLGPVYECLKTALLEVHDGRLDPRRAHAIGTLAAAIVKMVTAVELEQRVRELEQRLPR
jgi:hypothetical protein